MRYLNGNYYAGVNGKRYIFHPTEIITLRLPEETKSLRTQYQVQNDTQIRKNQNFLKIITN